MDTSFAFMIGAGVFAWLVVGAAFAFWVSSRLRRQMNAVDRLGRFEIARRLFAFEQPNAFHGFKRDVVAAKKMDDERGAGWDGAGSMNPAIDRAWLNAQQLG